jgi:hypothetical protein
MSNEPSQLTTDLATLLEFAAGNRTKAAAVIEQAKHGLGINKLTKSLTPADKAAIVQWHTARLTDHNQLDIETIAPPVAINEPIEVIIEQAAPLPPAIDDKDAVIAELRARLDVIERKTARTYADHETVRLTFNALGKRQGVWLKGYLVNALMVAVGIEKKNLPTWLSACEFESDGNNAITEQVKRLIIRELESELIKSRG